MFPDHFLIDGLAVPRAGTKIAAKSVQIGRTRYLEGAKVLGLTPMTVLRKSLWTPEQAQRIFDYYAAQAAQGDTPEAA